MSCLNMILSNTRRKHHQAD